MNKIFWCTFCHCFVLKQLKKKDFVNQTIPRFGYSKMNSIDCKPENLSYNHFRPFFFFLQKIFHRWAQRATRKLLIYERTTISILQVHRSTIVNQFEFQCKRFSLRMHMQFHCKTPEWRFDSTGSNKFNIMLELRGRRVRLHSNRFGAPLAAKRILAKRVVDICGAKFYSFCRPHAVRKHFCLVQ